MAHRTYALNGLSAALVGATLALAGPVSTGLDAAQAQGARQSDRRRPGSSRAAAKHGKVLARLCLSSAA